VKHWPEKWKKKTFVEKVSRTKSLKTDTFEDAKVKML
jgi:hypothetical protein